MLYPRKLLRHNSRELPIFTDQTAALSVKGGLEGRKKALQSGWKSLESRCHHYFSRDFG
jgi:predicted component of type VI protein secretion system